MVTIQEFILEDWGNETSPEDVCKKAEFGDWSLTPSTMSTSPFRNENSSSHGGKWEVREKLTS